MQDMTIEKELADARAVWDYVQTLPSVSHVGLLGHSQGAGVYPLMANFCAKTMPYRGLGSGIPRVLKEDSDVQFVDNKEGNQFTAIIKRPVLSEADNTTTDVVKDGGLNGGKVGGLQLTERQRAIIELIKENPFLTAKAISEKISEKASEKTSENFSVSDRTIETDIAELRRMGVLCRMKGRKKGYYEIIE